MVLGACQEHQKDAPKPCEQAHSCVGTQKISCVYTQEISCVYTEEISCVYTHEMSCVSTKDLLRPHKSEPAHMVLEHVFSPSGMLPKPCEQDPAHMVLEHRFFSFIYAASSMDSYC